MKEQVNRECLKEAVQRGTKLRREDAPGNRNLGAPYLKETYRKLPGKLNLSSLTFSITEFVCVSGRSLAKCKEEKRGDE